MSVYDVYRIEDTGLYRGVIDFKENSHFNAWRERVVIIGTADRVIKLLFKSHHAWCRYRCEVFR